MLHKFRDHEINPETEMLILGTFHPDTSRSGDFFYTETGNFLWKILPACYDEDDLRRRQLSSKKEFMARHRIDFADIIDSLKPGQEYRFGDEFIDDYVDKWNNIENLIDGLDKLQAVYFTRKTFGRIPCIEERIAQIRNHCVEKCLRFSLLGTPARHSDLGKILNWKMTMIDKTICR
jgi:G:T/U-mismatch repair DNA glycosylase